MTTAARNARKLTVYKNTAKLREHLTPEPLESVLASLKFKRIILSYAVTETRTSITLSAARALMLDHLLGQPQED